MPAVEATPRVARRPRGAVATAALLLLAAEVGVFLASTVPGVRGDTRFHDLLDGWLQGAAYVTTAVVAVLGSRRAGRHRRAWLWIAAGLVARAVGFVVFLAIVRRHPPVDYPSFADGAWLLMPLLLAVGLVRFARQPTRAVVARVTLDALAGALSAAALALTLLYGTLVALTAPGLPSHIVATNIAYPITDILLVFVIVGVFTTWSWRVAAGLWIVGAGVVGFAVCDAVFLYESTRGTFHPGSGVSALSLAATALIAVAPFAPAETPVRVSRRDVSQVLAPAVAALTCVALLVYAAREEPPFAVVVLATAGLLVTVLRTLLAILLLQSTTRALRERDARLQRSEAQAAAEADRLSAVVAGITEYAVIGARQTHVTFFSPGAERMLGYTAEEVIGHHPAEIFNLPDELAQRARELGVDSGAAALVAGATESQAVTRRWTYVRKDGSRLPVELTITGLGDGEYLGVARDVTSEETLARHRATREALGELLSGGLPMDEALEAAVRIVSAEMDWDLGILWLADGDEIAARHVWQRPEIASDEYVAGIRAVRAAAGEGVTGRLWQDATPVWIEDLKALEDLTPGEGELRETIVPGQETLVAMPVRGVAPGDLPLGVLQLVGHRRPRDPELMELLETIGVVIGRYLERERSAEELRAARDAAELADRTKSAFVSRISHELRTPLNAILGFAQLLERDTADPVQQERITQIVAGGRHLTDMIDDLLDVALVERGEMGVSMEPVAATDVLREVLDLTRPLVAERHLELEVDAHQGLFRYVHADYQRLRQVLLNLISNAVKYNRRGGRIKVAFDASDEARLCFLVSDTGPGIDAEQLSRMFRPFERLGAEEGREQGTGLGLFVSKGLVEAMGGDLRVTTEPGVGSTFVVDLPRAEPPVEPDTPPAPATRAAADVELPPASILYIEDNAANIRLVRDILTAQPAVRLGTETEGVAGLDRARRERPDLILLDVHLPDIGGDEILLRLKADDTTAAIPVVVISADAGAGHERRFVGAGADAYLTKPLDVDRFLLTVRDALVAVRPPQPVPPTSGADG